MENSKRKKITINQQGLSNGVSGSCYILNVTFEKNGKKLKYLVDAGMFLGEETYNDVQRHEESTLFNGTFPMKDVSSIDSVFITHAHIDHIGRLPYLVKEGFKGTIYVSRGTAELMSPALYDCSNVLSKRKNYPESAKYSSDDVKKTMELVHPVDFEFQGDFKKGNSKKKKSPKKKGKKTGTISPNVVTIYNENHNEVKVHYFANGHLLGSASILLEFNSYNNDGELIDNVNLFYTGDYKEKNIFFNAPQIPPKYYNWPITIITESTYGDSVKAEEPLYQTSPGVSHVNAETGEIFKEDVIRCIADGGSLLVPIIALERTEVILKELKELQDTGILIFMDASDDRNKPIINVIKNCQYIIKYVDEGKRAEAFDKLPVQFDFETGKFKLNANIPILLFGRLANTYLNMFLKSKNLGVELKDRKFVPENFHFCTENPASLLKVPGQRIILSTPGMMNGGSSLTIARIMAENERNWIHFTSFVATGIAKSLIDAPKGSEIVINNLPTKVNATVVQTSEFSGHARQGELLDYINRFHNLKAIIVTHGTPMGKLVFASVLKRKRPDVEQVCVSSRKIYFTITSEGVSRVVNSKIDHYYPIKDSDKKRVTTINPKRKQKGRGKKNKKYGKRRLIDSKFK